MDLPAIRYFPAVRRARPVPRAAARRNATRPAIARAIRKPALIWIVSGEITQCASPRAVSILPRAGEAARESRGLAQWRKNTATAPAMPFSADFFHGRHGPHMM